MRIIALAVALIAACRSAPPNAPAAPATPAASGETHPTAPAGPFPIEGEYVNRPTNCHGSPENPNCVGHLEIVADGTGSLIGDDISEPITWTADGDTITVQIGSRTYAYERQSDGSLIGPGDGLWTRVTR